MTAHGDTIDIESNEDWAKRDPDSYARNFRQGV